MALRVLMPTTQHGLKGLKVLKALMSAIIFAMRTQNVKHLLSITTMKVKAKAAAQHLLNLYGLIRTMVIDLA